MCRRHGISETTFYRWKANFGGMVLSDAKRLGHLEAENSRLKRLLAEAHLDNTALKDLLVTPAARRRADSMKVRAPLAGVRSGAGAVLRP